MSNEIEYDQSFGIVPLIPKSGGGWQVLLVKQKAGHWGFPKGHKEEGELPQEAASRELSEETGLRIKKILLDATFNEYFEFHFQGKKIGKTVSYYVAEVEGQVSLQPHEVSDFQWVNLEDSKRFITFPEGKKIAGEVIKALS